jgi:hypothetical protein
LGGGVQLGFCNFLNLQIFVCCQYECLHALPLNTGAAALGKSLDLERVAMVVSPG